MKTKGLIAALIGMALILAVPALADARPRPPDRRSFGYRPAYVSPPPRAQVYSRGYRPAVVVTEAQPLQPVESVVRGYLGVAGVAGWVGGDTGARSFGTSMSGGFDLFGGVELGQWVAVELDWRYLSLRDETYVRTSLNQLTAGAKVFVLPKDWRVRPYAALGAGLAVLSPLEPYRPRPVGLGLDLGVGADVTISRHFAIGAKLSWRPMFLDDADLGAPRGAGRSDLHDLSLSMRLQVTF